MKADCWLSPQGKFYYGLSHLDIAEGILARVYKLTIDTAITEEEFYILQNPERYLEERGGMKYINRCNIGWWIHQLKVPTQAQINAAFDETGDDISKMVSLYGIYHFLIIFDSSLHSEGQETIQSISIIPPSQFPTDYQFSLLYIFHNLELLQYQE